MTCYFARAAKLKKISQFKKSLQYLGKMGSGLLGYVMGLHVTAGMFCCLASQL